MARKQRTHEQYLEILQEKGIDILPVEEYQGSNTKILHRCPAGHEWPALPATLLRGQKCPICRLNGKV